MIRNESVAAEATGILTCRDTPLPGARSVRLGYNRGMFKNRILQSTLFITGLIVLGALFGVFTSEYYQRNEDPEIAGLLWPNPKQLRPFATIDQDREVFGLDRMRGKWSLLFFGYTHCPDICPLTMATLNEFYDQFKKDNLNNDLQVIFVTVDPQRDTAEMLKSYVEYFNTDFIGLGGNQLQVDSLTRQLGIAYMLYEQDERGDYLVDHSASVSLVDPEGRLLAVFQAPHTPATIHDTFLEIRDFYNSQS